MADIKRRIGMDDGRTQELEIGTIVLAVIYFASILGLIGWLAT